MTTPTKPSLNSTTQLVLRPQQTATLIGVHDVTLRRWESAGSFPKRFKLCPDSGPYGAVGHDRAEVEKWLEVRRGSRDTEAAAA